MAEVPLGCKELWAIILSMSDQECGVCNHAKWSCNLISGSGGTHKLQEDFSFASDRSFHLGVFLRIFHDFRAQLFDNLLLQ